MAEQPPLQQRTSGRRAERRRHREEEASESTEKRRPSEEVETRIQQAIDERARLFQGSTTRQQYEAEPMIDGNYEYLDHTADIQLHSWGDSLEEALEYQVVAMFGYMTQLNLVEVNDSESTQYASCVEAKGHDLCSLVFDFLQEWLCVFHETNFVVKKVKVEQLERDKFTIKSSGCGERADWSRHVQGTEVKAITYSNMQVVEDEKGEYHIWVIVDI